MANVPIQSLIDHIKTAIDVDPWAKEMAEELLKKQEPVEPKVEPGLVPPFKVYSCGHCDTVFLLRRQKYCAMCGRAVKWDGIG